MPEPFPDYGRVSNVRQPVAISVDDGGSPIQLLTHPAVSAEIRVRNHPNRQDVFGILVVAGRIGEHPIALHHALDPLELEELGRQAAKAAAHIREHRRKAAA